MIEKTIFKFKKKAENLQNIFFFNESSEQYSFLICSWLFFRSKYIIAQLKCQYEQLGCIKSKFYYLLYYRHSSIQAVNVETQKENRRSKNCVNRGYLFSRRGGKQYRIIKIIKNCGNRNRRNRGMSLMKFQISTTQDSQTTLKPNLA